MRVYIVQVYSPPFITQGFLCLTYMAEKMGIELNKKTHNEESICP